MRRYCGTRNPTSAPLVVGVMQLDSLGGDGAAWQLGSRAVGRPGASVWLNGPPESAITERGRACGQHGLLTDSSVMSYTAGT